MCGLIVAPGAVLGTTLRALLWQCHGEADERATCVGLVELSALAELLRSNGSLHAVIAAMRTVPENVLPIVVATATGVRVSSVACRGVGAAASA